MAISQLASIFFFPAIAMVIVFGSQECAFAAPGREAAWTPLEQQKGYVVFPHNTLERLPASLVPDRKMIADRISCELARGEFESVQIGVHVLTQGVTDVGLNVESDLEVTVYTRRSPDVELKWPGLTKPVDVWDRAPDDTLLEPANVLEDVPRGKSANFWLTFHAPAETSAGVHKSKIRIKPEGRPQTELELEIHVRPFQLQRPRIAFAMYHNEDYLPGYLDRRSKELTERIYQDMVDHGQTAATFYSGGDFSQLPPKRCHMIETQLPLAKKVGLVDPNIACMLLGGDMTSLGDEKTRVAVAWMQDE